MWNGSGVLIAVKPEVSRIKRHEELMTSSRMGNQPGPELAPGAGPWPAAVCSCISTEADRRGLYADESVCSGYPEEVIPTRKYGPLSSLIFESFLIRDCQFH